jgi:hypothetical protein
MLEYRTNGWRKAWVLRPTAAGYVNIALNGWGEAWVLRLIAARCLNISPMADAKLGYCAR